MLFSRLSYSRVAWFTLSPSRYQDMVMGLLGSFGGGPGNKYTGPRVCGDFTKLGGIITNPLLLQSPEGAETSLRGHTWK